MKQYKLAKDYDASKIMYKKLRVPKDRIESLNVPKHGISTEILDSDIKLVKKDMAINCDLQSDTCENDLNQGTKYYAYLNTHKKRLAKIMYVVIQSFMIVIMLFASTQIFENLASNVTGSEHMDVIADFVMETDGGATAVPTPNRDVPEYPVATPERVTYPEEGLPNVEQLRKLESYNEDFCFWIYIPGSQVNYYVLQGENNEEYLWTNIFHNYSDSGSCFLDYRCNAETMEGHTIIYGHTMNNLSMFGRLRQWLNESFFYNHRYIYTCGVDETTVWKIFSVYYTTVSEYYIQTSFNSDESYLSFITDLANKSIYATDTVLTKDDDVLTLSTCYRPYGGTNGRLTVHAVKLGTIPAV